MVACRYNRWQAESSQIEEIKMQTRIYVLSVVLSSAFAAQNLVFSQEAVAESEKPLEPEKDRAGDAEFDALSKLLTNSIFEGHFTIDGQDAPPKKEQYFLRKVKKLPSGDDWGFQARIKYGDHDATFPLSLPIKWSGKTPVITVDNFTIPGWGTFNARVLISDGKYAGTWQHGKVGGHLYGTIKRDKSSDESAQETIEEPAELDTKNQE